MNKGGNIEEQRILLEAQTDPAAINIDGTTLCIASGVNIERKIYSLNNSCSTPQTFRVAVLNKIVISIVSSTSEIVRNNWL